MRRDFKKEFINCLKSIDYSKHDRDVFTDFVEVAALSFANSLYQCPKLENEYFQVIDRSVQLDFLHIIITHSNLIIPVCQVSHYFYIIVQYYSPDKNI